MYLYIVRETFETGVSIFFRLVPVENEYAKPGIPEIPESVLLEIPGPKPESPKAQKLENLKPRKPENPKIRKNRKKIAIILQKVCEIFWLHGYNGLWFLGFRVARVLFFRLSTPLISNDV